MNHVLSTAKLVRFAERWSGLRRMDAEAIAEAVIGGDFRRLYAADFYGRGKDAREAAELISGVVPEFDAELRATLDEAEREIRRERER